MSNQSPSPLIGLAGIFRRRVDAFIARHGRPGRWLAAASGGLDSSVLLHLAAQVLPAARLHVCHLHHGLRGADADADRDLVKKQARELGLTFHGRAAQVRELARAGRRGIEETARRARLDFFADLAAAAPPDKPVAVLLAHHADDQVETILFRWRRGTSWRGLGGMAREVEFAGAGARRAFWLLRPLLDATRGELRAYAIATGLSWREDATNSDPRHTRNAIRHRLRPRLEAAIPDLSGQCLDLAARASRLDAVQERFAVWWLERFARPHRDGGVWLPATGFPAPPAGGAGDSRGEAGAVILRRACESWTGTPPRAPSRAVLGRLVSLLAGGRAGQKVELPGTWRAIRDRYGMLLERNPASAKGVGSGETDCRIDL